MVYLLFKAFVFNLCIMGCFLCFLTWFSFFFFATKLLNIFDGYNQQVYSTWRGGGGGKGSTVSLGRDYALVQK